MAEESAGKRVRPPGPMREHDGGRDMKGRGGMDETVGVPAASSGDALLHAVLSAAVDQAILAIDTRCQVTAR